MNNYVSYQSTGAAEQYDMSGCWLDQAALLSFTMECQAEWLREHNAAWVSFPGQKDN